MMSLASYLINWYPLDSAILARRHPEVFTNTDHAFDCPIMRQGTRVAKEIWLCVWSIEIEDPYFLLLATSQKMRSR